MTGKAVPMSKVAIYGATGYTGFELIRLLLSHSRAKIAALPSEQYSDQPVEQAFPPFRGMLPNVIFGKMEQIRAVDVDAVFLALPHTVSASVAAEILPRGARVFALSADFRFRSIPLYEAVYGVRHVRPDLAEHAVYGLPEIHRDALRKTRLAAVPGCFPTAVVLALYPLLKDGLIEAKGIVADCKTGVSGGGGGPSLGLHSPGGGGSSRRATRRRRRRSRTASRRSPTSSITEWSPSSASALRGSSRRRRTY